MKNRLYLLAISFLCLTASAQQVPKTVIAEHFSNTYCSVCATNNPGLFSNLTSFPQVLHITYYPSSPYVACPLSMHNVTENNARTNYYGIFGSTPKLVVAGSLAPFPFTSATIYSSQTALTSSFTLSATLQPVGADSISVRVKVKKVDTSSLSALELYGAVVEDTLFFTANNGETKQYDVFRKALWGTSSLSVTAPVSVGDSTIYSKTVALNSVWNANRLYAMVILQQPNKQVVQAAKSARFVSTIVVNTTAVTKNIAIYPNPTSNLLYIKGNILKGDITIVNEAGISVKIATIHDEKEPIDISSLPAGMYLLTITDGSESAAVRFIKK